LPLTPTAQAQPVYTADGRQQKLIGTTRLQLCCGTYAASVKAQVVELGRDHQLILGYAWLTAVNPRIDFRRRLVRITEHGQTHVLTPAATRRVTSESMGYLSATQAKRALQKGQRAYVVYVNALVREPGQPLELSESDTQQRHVPETGVQKHAEPVQEPDQLDLSDVISEYSDVLGGIPAGLPPQRVVDHRIDIKPGSQPPALPIYRMSAPELAELRTQVDDLLEKGFIRPSTSPYAAPVLFVPKKNGTKRLCIDYRALNKQTIANRWPLPRIDDLLDTLKGSTRWTLIDLAQAYNQLRIYPPHVHRTAFRTKYGQYEYLVMPFGLQGAPGSFQRLMNSVFKDYLEKFVLVYLDDILVYSPDDESHKEHVRAVLKRLREHKLYAQRQKCKFGLSQVDYLGHIITRDGISMDPSKTRAIIGWPTPTSVTEVRQFLGLAGYYRRFIKDFSGITAPLTDLQRKGTPWQWGPQEHRAFDALKTAITSAPVLRPFDPDKPTSISIDASGTAIGAVLTQGTGADIRPVAFESRKLTPAEKNYPTHEREQLAIMHALRLWRHYLLGKQFTIKTDNSALQYLRTQKNLSGRQARWMQLLEQYDFTVQHVPGKSNVVADALSRRPDLAVNTLVASTLEPHPLLDRVLAARASDDRYMAVLAKVQANQPPLGITLGHDGLLYKLSGPTQRLYVPTALQADVITEAHSTPVNAHLGMDKTYEKLRRRYYWPGMVHTIRAYVRTCDACQRHKYPSDKPQGLLQPLPIPDRKWSSVSMDLITKLPTTPSGFDSLLVIVDRLTKRIHLAPTAESADAPAIARLFFDTVFRHHGLPQQIVSDRDPRFVSNFWRALFSLTGTKLAMSTSNHPQTDGQTERANRVIEEMLRPLINQRHDDWDQHLTAIEYAYNDSVQASTGHTPFYLDYGQHPWSPVDFFNPTTHGNVSSSNDTADTFATRLQETIAAAKSSIQRAQQSQKKHADKRRKPHPTFNVDDLVLLSATAVHGNGAIKLPKLDPRWYGPFPVVQQINNVSYKLQLPQDLRIHPVFHVSVLKRYHGTPSDDPPPGPVAVIDGEEHFIVEAVIKHALRRNVDDRSLTERHYLVHWQGYSPFDRTWEPYSRVHVLDVVRDYEARLPPAQRWSPGMVQRRQPTPRPPPHRAAPSPRDISPPPQRTSARIAARTQRFQKGGRM